MIKRTFTSINSKTSANISHIFALYLNKFPSFKHYHICTRSSMEDFDPAYIQPIEHRPILLIHEAEGIPIIDLSSITNNHLSNENDHSNNNNLTSLITEIGNACEKWGFFQVINHGVPLEKLEQIEQTGRKFFALSKEEKWKVGRDEHNPMGYYDSEHTKNVRDWKQVFDFTARDPSIIPVCPGDLQPKELINRWPQSLPEFR